MALIIIFEGYNDYIFLDETLQSTLKYSTDIKYYETPVLLINDIRANNQKLISLLKGGGINGCVKLPTKLSRTFWGTNKDIEIGIIIDGGSKKSFNKVIKYLTEYMNTPCKQHNVIPSISIDEKNKKVTISFDSRSDITFWVINVPNSLEIQIARVLKENHSEFKGITSEDEVIRAAMTLLGKNREEVIRYAVSFFKDKKWYTTFCMKLVKRIR